MKGTILALLFLLCLYLLSFCLSKPQEFEFMSKKHTNILKGLAALIISIQHVSGRFNLRFFTPGGGWV